MKKKLNLIVVGNKPINEDLSTVIDSFDYIIRVSRMNNYGNTGYRIDGLFLEANRPFKEIYKGGEYKNHFISARKVFMCPYWYDKFVEWEDYLSEDQYKNVELIDDLKISQIVGFDRLTSSIRIIVHLLNSDWNRKYNIYFTAIDIEDRIHFVDHDPYWSYHKGAGRIERDYLIEQINKNQLIRI